MTVAVGDRLHSLVLKTKIVGSLGGSDGSDGLRVSFRELKNDFKIETLKIRQEHEGSGQMNRLGLFGGQQVSLRSEIQSKLEQNERLAVKRSFRLIGWLFGRRFEGSGSDVLAFQGEAEKRLRVCGQVYRRLELQEELRLFGVWS